MIQAQKPLPQIGSTSSAIPSSSEQAVEPFEDPETSSQRGIPSDEGDDDSGVADDLVNSSFSASDVAGLVAKSSDADFFVTRRAGAIADSQNLGINEDDIEYAGGSANRPLQRTLLQHKRNEMADAQAALQRTRLEFARRMRDVRARQAELRARQSVMRERVQRFRRLLGESDAKRQRAAAKATAERRAREAREVELHALIQQSFQESEQAADMVRDAEKISIYAHFLEKVSGAFPPGYLGCARTSEPHISDILARHRTLAATHEGLLKQLQERADAVENAQHELVEIIKRKNDRVLVLNSKVGTAQKHIDKLRGNCAHLQLVLEQRENAGTERTRTLGAIKAAIDNMASSIRVGGSKAAALSGKGRSDEKDIYVERLNTIQERLLDLASYRF